MSEEKIKKEVNSQDSFDYESMWGKEEEKKDKKLIEELPKGMPRKGIKGYYIKRKKHITQNQIRYSYGGFVKKAKNEFNNL